MLENLRRVIFGDSERCCTGVTCSCVLPLPLSAPK